MKMIATMFQKETTPGGTFGTIQGGVLHPFQIRKKYNAEMSSSAPGLYITQNTNAKLSPCKDENCTFEMAANKDCEHFGYYKVINGIIL